MNVLIVERDGHKVVAQYNVNVGGINYALKGAGVLRRGVDCAVSDGVVKRDERDKYWFKIEDPKTPS